jgi:hypothetical protein
MRKSIVKFFVISILLLGFLNEYLYATDEFALKNLTVKQKHDLEQVRKSINKYIGDFKVDKIDTIEKFQNKNYLLIYLDNPKLTMFNAIKYDQLSLERHIYQKYILSMLPELNKLNKDFPNIYGYRIYSLVDLHSFIEQDSNSIVLSVKKILGYKIGDNIEYEFYLSKKDVEEYMNNKITDKQLANRITILENGHRISIF